jgi:cytochrome oxidase Cu insertion factor (SCO1/SenC/PrrC family)
MPGCSATLVAALSLAAAAHELSRGAPRMEFAPPAAGTYELRRIQWAPHGRVLESSGRAAPLSDFTTGKITLLSFVYTYCSDPVGCPLAYATFVALRERVVARPELARRVRFVSLSFDPANDTPEAMKLYGGTLADPAAPLRWHFLTTRSVRELKPIVDGFGQDVSVELDERGRPTRVFNHLVKVFLLDSRGQVREIYTTAFLLPDMMFNDIETLHLEELRG